MLGADVTAAGAQAARTARHRPHPSGTPAVRADDGLENLLVAHLHGAKGAGRPHGPKPADPGPLRPAEFAGTRPATLACSGSSGWSSPGRSRSGRASCCSTRSVPGLIDSELRELIDAHQVAASGGRGDPDRGARHRRHPGMLRPSCRPRRGAAAGLRPAGSGAQRPASRRGLSRHLRRRGGTGHGGPGHGRPRAGRARQVARPLLEVKGVAASYGAFRALHDVSFSVAEGEVLALLGTNGAGKTTTAGRSAACCPSARARSGSTATGSTGGGRTTSSGLAWPIAWKAGQSSAT